ncbi:MAG TPA: branched-chain amino acid ABC transporter permease [Actinomycetota bacterium]|nr:branched-chain amino acid ABC transporter permease [Actinomycetota bacterium]
MRPLLALASVIAIIFAWAYGDSKVGGRVREFYDKREKWMFPVVFAAFFGVFALLTTFLDVAKLELGFLVGYNALLAMGLNVVVGYAGLLDLGYVAFFAVGAYTMAILSNAGPIQLPWDLGFWQILPLGIVIAMITGVILGGPTLRLRGDYLAIVTLGFGEIVRIVAQNLDGVTNGARGITGVENISMFGKSLGLDPKPYYLLTLFFIGVAAILIRSLNNSRVGRAWAAIREDEVAAEAMGVPTLKYKLWAFAIGAAVASVGGMVFAAKVTFIDPVSFHLIISIFILSAVVLGGLGSTAGVMVGAVLINVLPEMLRGLSKLGTIGDKLLDARFGIFGLVLVIMMIFRPEGIVPSRRRAAEMKGGAEETKGPTGGGLPAEPAPAGGDE